MQQAELRVGDEESFLHPSELEEELRQGRLPCSAEVRYAPWTGTEFARLETIATLTSAVDAPAARAAARLARRPVPWATSLLCLLLILAFFLEVWLSQRGLELARRGAVGFESTILEAAWWSAWTAPWLHADLRHLVLNLPLLAYCCFRVERVLGMTGLVQVLLGASLGAALLLVPFSALPAVGSSSLAFGAWGAQLGLGLRLKEAIPSNQRSAYGWRSYILCAFFLMPGFSAPNVSVLAHVGGYFGGLAVSLWVLPETLAPRTGLGLTRLRALGVCLGLLALPAGLAWLLASSPTLLCALNRPGGVPKHGLELSLCWRMAKHPGSLAGLDAWQVGPSSDSALFAASHLLRQPDELDPELLQQDWERRLGESVIPSELPALQEGWRAWTFTAKNRRVFEQARVEGARIYRIGWYTQRTMAPPREAFYEAALRTVRLSESAELKGRREAWSKQQNAPQRAYEYAAALQEVGRYEEALAIFSGLETREDGWEWESTRARFQLCSTHPRLAACSGAWREDWLKKAELEDVEIRVPAIRWLVAEGRCAEAQEQALQLKGLPEVEPDEVKEALGTCEAPHSALPR
ncbi:rhomboid family intramembrane serine protease [Archangium lansingense]|uniref:Rhomboid family intramembrane serine protease n=1 Tax=Archangium lansingense TaxID=2995310 RepID=A0ABT4A4L7_9BACT|nr:rhomboid family intramembrane serine protease [Archangium lansinium]MCY1075907.1 rhomboid family intramembrane serine protease [Archangium lansinium]